jgi:hypothetical protein
MPAAAADGDAERAADAHDTAGATPPASPAAESRAGWQWREPFDSLLYLAACGMAGTLARAGLVHLFACYSTAARGGAASPQLALACSSRLPVLLTRLPLSVQLRAAAWTMARCL